MRDAFDELPSGPIGRCRCYIEPILKESDTMSEHEEPEYYNSNGLSPIGAMKQGLISRDEYIGFLKGNIIKYIIRAQYKGNAAEDLMKARNYIDFYLELITDEKQTERPPKYGHYELAKREDI